VPVHGQSAEAADGEVQAFHGGLLGGEVAADANGATEAGVQALDCVRRVDDLADLRTVGEGHELSQAFCQSLMTAG